MAALPELLDKGNIFLWPYYFLIYLHIAQDLLWFTSTLLVQWTTCRQEGFRKSVFSMDPCLIQHYYYSYIVIYTLLCWCYTCICPLSYVLLLAYAALSRMITELTSWTKWLSLTSWSLPFDSTIRELSQS